MMPISLAFFPCKNTTQVNNFNHEWRPADFPSFLEELYGLQANIKEACLYRGHRKSEWLIDSTFARSLKTEYGVPLIHRYSDEQINDVIHQHSLAKRWINKADKAVISPDLEALISQGIDPFYEYHRHLQQNPEDVTINDIPPYGSNFTDFSEDWRVALFFANTKRNSDDEGALFIVRQTAMGPVLHRGKAPLQETFHRLKSHLLEKPEEMYNHLPRWIEPDYQLHNSLDPKLKRQKAVYLAQMDFRVDFGLSWELLSEETRKQVFVKLVLPKGTHFEVENFLREKGITQEYLFPKTIFDQTPPA